MKFRKPTVLKPLGRHCRRSRWVLCSSGPKMKTPRPRFAGPKSEKKTSSIFGAEYVVGRRSPWAPWWLSPQRRQCRPAFQGTDNTRQKCSSSRPSNKGAGRSVLLLGVAIEDVQQVIVSDVPPEEVGTPKSVEDAPREAEGPKCAGVGGPAPDC